MTFFCCFLRSVLGICFKNVFSHKVLILRQFVKTFTIFIFFFCLIGLALIDNHLLMKFYFSTCLFVLQFVFKAAIKVDLPGPAVLFLHTPRSSRVLARTGDPTPLSCAACRGLSNGATPVPGFWPEGSALMGCRAADPLKSS